MYSSSSMLCLIHTIQTSKNQSLCYDGNWTCPVKHRQKPIDRVRTPFQKQNNFQDFSRSFPGLRLIFSRALKFTLTLTLPRSQCYCNSPCCLPYTSYFFVESNRSPKLSRTNGHFPGLSSPGKCHNKIPGLFQVFQDRYEPWIDHFNNTPLISIICSIIDMRK